MVVRILSIAKTWTDLFQAPPTPNHEESTNSKKTLVWATSFSSLIKLDLREKHLAPMASITYKKYKTLACILTNYKLIAHPDVQHDKTFPILAPQHLVGNVLYADTEGIITVWYFSPTRSLVVVAGLSR